MTVPSPAAVANRVPSGWTSTEYMGAHNDDDGDDDDDDGVDDEPTPPPSVEARRERAALPADRSSSLALEAALLPTAAARPAPADAIDPGRRGPPTHRALAAAAAAAWLPWLTQRGTSARTMIVIFFYFLNIRPSGLLHSASFSPQNTIPSIEMYVRFGKKGKQI